MNVAPKSWRNELPEFLQFLENDLKCPIRSHQEVLGFDYYLVDFSSWKLRFSDHTPVIWVSSDDLKSLEARDLSQSIVDVVRTRNLLDRMPIVFVSGDGTEIRERLRSSLLPISVIDKADQQAIWASRRPTGELQDRLSAQIPLALIAPYETSKPVTGSRFFGREFEIRRILQGGDSNFAIMGIRRIGKTSLMREVERRLREQSGAEEPMEGGRIQFIDCSALESPHAFVREVVRRLHTQELVRLDNKQFPLYFPDFLDRMARRYGGPLIFLLDEFDSVLTWHTTDPTVLNALRASSNMGHCRYIVGGFREVMLAFSSLSSPLYNFAKPVRLGEFTREQTAQLVLGPLETLRVRFERRNEVVDRIYNETAGQPNLIQYYCSILVEQLDKTGARVISPDQLFHVYDNPDFRVFILSTFMDNTKNLEKAVVFAVLSKYGYEQPFDLEAIDNALQERRINLPIERLMQACRHLELAGTLTQKGRHYHFSAPVFPRVLLETQNIDYLFRKAAQEGVWK